MAYKLRDFQEQAVSAAVAAVAKKRNNLIVMPTGSGKSVAIAGLIERLMPSANRRILIVSHVREILQQVHRAIETHLPDVSLGLQCAGLDRFDTGKHVTVASIQSIWWRNPFKGYHVCLVDEAHLISRKNASMYHQLFRRLQKAAAENRRGSMPIIGFTATPYRLDSGYLHRGSDAIFEGISYDVPLAPLISSGVLSPLTTDAVKGIDFSHLHIRAKEFAVQEFTESRAWFADTAACIAQAVKIAKGRRHWVVFACTVRHAEAIAELLNTAGISATVIHAGSKKQERDIAVKDFKAGKLRALVNVNVLTTGFDAPNIDCILLLRPTLSSGLYVQMVGRGMRRHGGKDDCLLLDFAGNIERHGALTDIVPRLLSMSKPQGDASPRVKVCPRCQAESAPFTLQCRECGQLFPVISSAPSAQHPLLPSEAMGSKPAKKPPQPCEPSDGPYLSTEEVAGMIGTTPQYVKQMRHLKTGPNFLVRGAMTALGWRQVVYKIDDVKKWKNSVREFEGENGRRWRFTDEGFSKLSGQTGKSVERWNDVDDAKLKKLWGGELSIEAIAQKLKRSKQGVKRRARLLNLPKLDPYAWRKKKAA